MLGIKSKGKIRVLHLGKYCPPKEGGIEIFTIDLLKNLNLKKDIQADLLCFKYSDEGKFLNENINIFRAHALFTFKNVPISIQYIKILRSLVKNYRIVHIHSPNPLAEILSLRLPSQIKLIIHWHADIVGYKSLYRFYRIFQRKVLERADKIIATSYDYLHTSKQLSDFKYKVSVIPLGVDSTRLNNEPYDKSLIKLLRNLSKGRNIVLSIGRLVPYKGFDYLIESAKYIRDNAIIIIVGTGPLYNKLSHKIKKLKLQNRVFLLNYQENIGLILKNAHIFCLPSISRSEAFGLVLIEALYYGKPLITTDIKGSGMNFININGKTGYKVPPRNPKYLAYAINRILSDVSLYNFFSRNSFKRFMEFDILKIVQDIYSLYRELV